MMKVICSIIKNEDPSNDKEKRGSTSAPFKETGVRRLLLLAVAPGMSENYQLMSELLQRIRPEDIGGLIIAADLIIIIIIGIFG